MKRFTHFPALLAAAVMLMGIQVAASSAAAQTNTAQTRTKSGAKAGKTKPENVKLKPAHPKPAVLATPEDITGTIKELGPSDKVLTLIGESGVPYDFRIDRGTRIRLQNRPDQTLTASQLAQEAHRRASIHFVPMANGNVARTIKVWAS